jgi:hypothetical protein
LPTGVSPIASIVVTAAFPTLEMGAEPVGTSEMCQEETSHRVSGWQNATVSGPCHSLAKPSMLCALDVEDLASQRQDRLELAVAVFG